MTSAPYPEHFKALVGSLQQRKARGELSPQDIKQAIELTGKHPKTINAWIKNGLPTHERPRYRKTDDDVIALMRCGCSFKRAHEMRAAHDPQVPPYSTWHRNVTRDLSPKELAFLRDGENGRRQLSLYAPYEVRSINERWEMDSCELKTIVTVPGLPKPKRPWLTSVLDCSTRAIMGYSVSIGGVATPDVLAALHDAITVHPDRGPFGGAPDLLVFDLALAHLGEGTTDALTALNIASSATRGYTPMQKGKKERFYRTLKEGFLQTLPFFGGTPKNAAGKRYQPSCPPPDLQSFLVGLDRHIDVYNRHHVHSALGRTGLEAWEADTQPLRLFAPDELAFLLTERVGRIVQKKGIEFRSCLFVAPELAGMVREPVEIRYDRHDLRAIEVFRDGQWVCRAPQRDPYDEDQATHIAQARRESDKPMNQLRRRATAEQRAATVSRNGSTAAPDPGSSSPSRTVDQRLDNAIARRASTKLLDLLERNPKTAKDDHG